MKVISFENITKAYNKNIKALDSVSFTVAQGETVGLIGPNGAGKSTIFKIIMQQIYPDCGHLTINGNIGYLPESVSIYEYLSAGEFIDFVLKLKKTEKTIPVIDLLKKVGIDNFCNQKVGTFSKGMLQRLGIAAAIASNPSVLVLDEPMNGLEPNGRREIISILKEIKSSGKTIMFSSHITRDIEILSDRVLALENGKIMASGIVDDIKSNDKMKGYFS